MGPGGLPPGPTFFVKVRQLLERDDLDFNPAITCSAIAGVVGVDGLIFTELTYCELAGVELVVVLQQPIPNRFGPALAAWLRSRGVDRLDAVLLLDTRVAFSGGYPDLAGAASARTTMVLASTRRNLPRLLNAHWQGGGRWRLANAPDSAALSGWDGDLPLQRRGLPAVARVAL